MCWFENRPIKYGLISVLAIITVLSTLRFIKHESIKAEKQEIATSLKLALSDSVLQYKSREINIIDLSKITTFYWDRLYVFGPYTNPTTIDKVVGKNWRDTCTTSIYLSDGIVLLIFTTNRHAVQCIEYGRGNGDFYRLEEYSDGIRIDKAHFVLDDTGTVILAEEK
jgi:hypothetical protein